MMKIHAIISLFVACLSMEVRGQDSLAQQTSDSFESEATQRVQYTLILPEEKTPELIKPDENNPFEVATGEIDKEGDSEENRVHDTLIGMTAVGGGSGPAGIRVMLGSMRLEVGQEVPKIIPDQQVILKVKSINDQFIELVWVEKTPTGLPPKSFVIPVDVSPTVRYVMPSTTAQKGGGPTGTLRRDDLAAQRPMKSSVNVVETIKPTVKAVAVDDQPPRSAVPSSPSNVPEASVMRMLFGNHAPQAK